MCKSSGIGSHRLSLGACKMWPERQACSGTLGPKRQQGPMPGAQKVEDLGLDPEGNGQPWKDLKLADLGCELGTDDRTADCRIGLRVRRCSAAGVRTETTEVTSHLIRVAA